jgi:hypothetical protein
VLLSILIWAVARLSSEEEPNEKALRSFDLDFFASF